MKAALMMACMLFASSALAADCVTNSNGKTVCSNGDKAVVVNKNTGTVKSAERSSGGTATTVQGRNGKAAVSQTDRNGVTTTKTTGGGEVKSKNGVGVAKTADGTTCVKGRNNQGCTKN